MRILYNVTIAIDPSVEKEWIDWMVSTHIPDVMATNKFISYSMQKVMGSTNETGTTYAVSYVAESYTIFEEYQQNYAPQLQKEHEAKYKGQYGAFRTIMEIISHS